MAYTENFYPTFADISLQHFHGYDPEVVLAEVVAWKELHPTYRFIGQNVSYWDGPCVSGKGKRLTDNPGENIWFEVVIIYTN